MGNIIARVGNIHKQAMNFLFKMFGNGHISQQRRAHTVLTKDMNPTMSCDSQLLTTLGPEGSDVPGHQHAYTYTTLKNNLKNH